MKNHEKMKEVEKKHTSAALLRSLRRVSTDREGRLRFNGRCSSAQKKGPAKGVFLGAGLRPPGRPAAARSAEDMDVGTGA